MLNPDQKSLLPVLIILIMTGVLVAVAGVYIVVGDLSNPAANIAAWHGSDPDDIMVQKMRSMQYGLFYSFKRIVFTLI